MARNDDDNDDDRGPAGEVENLRRLPRPTNTTAQSAVSSPTDDSGTLPSWGQGSVGGPQFETFTPFRAMLCFLRTFRQEWIIKSRNGVMSITWLPALVQT